jgi:heme-degrading monooxygenase HmoA
MSAEVEEAFRARPHLVDDTPGFVKMEVLTPTDDTTEFWLLTYWTDETSYREWHKSHLYRDSHAGIPKGLKLDPTATEVRGFWVVAE